MIFLLPIWLGASMGLGLGMLAFESRHPRRPGGTFPPLQPGSTLPGGVDALVSCEILAEEEGEEQLLLATEEIPLDNRQGSHNMVSEHEFTRTAKVDMEMARDRQTDGEMRADLWKLVQSKASLAVSRRWGMEVGGEIQRRVRLRFTVGPGDMVCHHVKWKQNMRRGVFQVLHPEGIMKVPYMVTYGLSHEVVTVSASSKGGQRCVVHLPQEMPENEADSA
ncbi:MAG: hypothetical protein HQL64_06825 [Magnetococcales bacterium]|nr:hypothetical protein [Magnetococcales bacterium]